MSGQWSVATGPTIVPQVGWAAGLPAEDCSAAEATVVAVGRALGARGPPCVGALLPHLRPALGPLGGPSGPRETALRVFHAFTAGGTPPQRYTEGLEAEPSMASGRPRT